MRTTTKAVAGESCVAALAGGAEQNWEFELEVGQVTTVRVEQQGIDVALRLFDPSGKRLLEMDGPYGNWGLEEVSWVAEAAGSFRLAVASDHEGVAPGAYTLEATEPKAATERDHTHAHLLAELCRADAARRSGKIDRVLEARDLYEEVLQGWRELGDVRWQLQALQRLGACAEILDEFETARRAYTEARDLAAESGDAVEQIRNANRLTKLALDQRRHERARELVDQALVLARSQDDPESLAFAENNRAVWLEHEGETDEAIRIYLELVDRWREMGRPVEEAHALHNLATNLDRQGRQDEAIEALERSVQTSRTAGATTAHARSLVSLGAARLRAGDSAGALEALETAFELGLVGRLGGRWEVHARHFLGLSLTHSADREARFEEAREHYRSGLQKAEEIGAEDLAALIELNMGAHYLEACRDDQALRHFRRALGPIREHGATREEAMARLGMGLALRGQGELSEALVQLETAVELVENERLATSSWELRMSFLASGSRTFEELVDLLAELHLRGEQPETGRPYAERALETVERRRARTLSDSIEELEGLELRNEVPSQLLEKERAISEDLRRGELELRSAGIGDPAAEARHRELLQELDSVRVEIRREHPQFAEVERPKPLSVEQIRADLLDEDSILLVYALGEKRSFVFRVGPSSEEVELRVLEPRAFLAAAVGSARELVQTLAESRKSRRDRELERLADLLLGLLYGKLDAARLVIVPDGVLELVPFAALRAAKSHRSSPTSAADDIESQRAYLLESHELALLPSASSLRALRQERERSTRIAPSIALVGDPVFSAADERLGGQARNAEQPALPPSVTETARSLGMADEALPRLPHTLAEVERIAERSTLVRYLRTGFDARKDSQFLAQLRTARIVHFATHALVDSRHPELSALALSSVDERGQPLDGFLYAYELYSERIAADLVLLSACETAVGRGLHGEGILGFARAFFYAGVRRVVMSLWNVGDPATASLMVSFYEHHLADKRPPAAALRAAQLELLASEDWAAPIFWAPFVLLGDWTHRARGLGAAGVPYEENAGGGGSSEPGGKGPALTQDAAEPEDEKVESISESGSGAGWHGQVRPRAANLEESAGNLGREACTSGIGADTGEPLDPLPDAATFARQRDAILAGPHTERQLERWVEHPAINDPEGLPVLRVQPQGASHRLDEAGWAVLFAPSVSAEEKEALGPLLELRRRQTGRLYLEETLPQPGVTSMQYRFQKELGFGPADPEVLPYYLLIVGDPEEIPFELQYGLDVQYAVGRLHFDRADDYARYAETVVRQETEPGPVRSATIFGVDTGKPVDRFMLEALVDPMTRLLQGWKGDHVQRPAVFRAPGDRKADLVQILQTPPGLLFTAGHGMRVSELDSPTFHLRQGALVCSGHQGGPVPLEACFSGDDVENLPNLDGLITFSFACYSAGVPRHDTFADDPFAPATRVAPRSMVSHLAKRMLARGAQAFVGHIDRAWDTSFDWSSGKGDQVKVFVGMLKQLLQGHRIGHTTGWINHRYAEAATAYAELLQKGFLGPTDIELLASVRKATLDARNYVVIGDPAVRLPGFAGR